MILYKYIVRATKILHSVINFIFIQRDISDKYNFILKKECKREKPQNRSYLYRKIFSNNTITMTSVYEFIFKL